MTIAPVRIVAKMAPMALIWSSERKFMSASLSRNSPMTARDSCYCRVPFVKGRVKRSRRRRFHIALRGSKLAPMSDMVFDLTVVPEGANGRTVMEVDSGTVVFTDEGPYTYCCGNCGADLIVGASPGQVG